MSEDLGRAVLELATESTKFVEDLEKAKKESEGLDAAFRKTGAALIGVGVAITGSMIATVTVTAKLGDELAKTSQRTGVSVEDLSKLRFAAGQSGASFEELTKGLKKLGKSMDEASKVFDKLGIDTKTTTGSLRPMQDVLLDVADKFALMEDGAQKAAIAQDLFGRGGIALIPLLNEGREGIAKLTGEAERLGGVFDEKTAKASEKFNDTVEQLELTIEGLGIGIAKALLPQLTSLAEKARETGIAIGNFAKEHTTLTSVIFNAGIALIGSGGFLLALGAVPPVLGVVTSGLVVLKTALLGMTGGLSSAATLLVSLGPAALIPAGIALVALTFKIAEATGLIDKLALTLSRFTSANKDVVDANNELSLVTARAALVLKEKYGVSIDQGSKSLVEWNREVTQAIRENSGLAVNVDEARKAAQRQQQQLIKNREAAAEFAKQVEDVTSKFLKEAQGGKVLEDALRQLEAKKTDTKKITTILGDDILKAASALHAQGLEIPPLIAKYADLIDATKLSTLIQTGLARSSIASAESLRENKKAVDEFIAAARKAGADVGNLPPLIAVDQTENALRVVFQGARRQAVQLSQDAHREAIEFRDFQIGLDNQTFEDRQRLRQKELEKLKEATQSIRESAGRVFDAMLSKGESVFSSLGALLNGGALSLGRSIFADITAALFGPIKKAFDDFFSAVLNPIISGFVGRLGKALGDALAGILGTGKKTIFSDVAGSLAGGLVKPAAGILGGLGLGSLFGGTAALGFAAGGPAVVAGSLAGSAAALSPLLVPPALPAVGIGAGTAAASAGTAAASSGGVLSSIGALASNPITIAAAAALGLFFAFGVGKGRKTADRFVQEFQNPFGEAITKIEQTFTAQLQAGTLTVEQAQDATQKVKELWDVFLTNAKKFAEQGKTERKVVDQALTTLSFVPTVISDMERAVAKLEEETKTQIRQMQEQGALAEQQAAREAKQAQDEADAIARSADVSRILTGALSEMQQRLIDAGISGATLTDAVMALDVGFDATVKAFQARLVELDKTRAALDLAAKQEPSRIISGFPPRRPGPAEQVGLPEFGVKTITFAGFGPKQIPLTFDEFVRLSELVKQGQLSEAALAIARGIPGLIDSLLKNPGLAFIVSSQRGRGIVTPQRESLESAGAATSGMMIQFAPTINALDSADVQAAMRAKIFPEFVRLLETSGDGRRRVITALGVA